MSKTSLIEKTIINLGYELIEINQSAKGELKIFIDLIDPKKNINVNDCEVVTKQLLHVLAVENVEFSRLEVSSPGLNRRLVKFADFLRFVDCEIVVKLKFPKFGGRRKNFKGKILQPVNNLIKLNVIDGKKSYIIELNFSEIDVARLVPKIDFKVKK